MSDPSGASPALQVEQQMIRARCFHPSGSFVEFKKEEIEQSISDRFDNMVARHGDRIAVKTKQHLLRYDDLNRAANRVAHQILDRLGTGKRPIGLLFENGAQFVIASLGALKAGKIQISLESSFPLARLRYVLEQSQAVLLLTNNTNLALAKQLAGLPVVNIDEIGDQVSCRAPGGSVHPDTIAALAYTSGSTGHPKGIVWNQRGVLHAVMRHTNTSNISSDDRLLMFRTSLRAYLYALLTGATYYPVDLRHEEFDLAEWMIKEEITVYRAAVSAFRSFARSLIGTNRFPKLRLIFLFGEPVYYSDVELYRAHFADSSILASSLGCMEFDDYACFFIGSDTPITSGVVPGGYPIAETDIRLLDETARPVSRGQIGEIAIRSRYNAIGYWRRPDLDQSTFLPDPQGGDEPIYRTGDLGRMRPDGCLLHLGRKDFQVKIRGHRVEVAEVETALLSLDSVREAVVVGHEEIRGEKRLVAYLIPAGSQVLSVSELRRQLGESLPDYMVPSTFIVLDAFPLTATGKVDRRALPSASGARPELNTSFMAPRTPTEAKLARIWAETLGLDRIGVHDQFLELGGDSVLATRVISRVLEEFEIRLSIRALLKASTVVEMAYLVVQSQVRKRRRRSLDS